MPLPLKAGLFCLCSLKRKSLCYRKQFLPHPLLSEQLSLFASLNSGVSDLFLFSLAGEKHAGMTPPPPSVSYTHSHSGASVLLMVSCSFEEHPQ